MKNVNEKQIKIGDVFESTNFGKFKILSYQRCNQVKVKFLNTGYETTTTTSAIFKGSVKDRQAPFVEGVGIVGDISPNSNFQTRRFYDMWKGMLKRCYNEHALHKRPSYKGCSVSEKFLNFSSFYTWCLNQIGHDQEGWHLDKDILVKGNKVYSPETCCFVPPEINILLAYNKAKESDLPTGVLYSKEKRKYRVQLNINGTRKHVGYFEDVGKAHQAYLKIKNGELLRIAEKWKSLIDENVYLALISYID